ncbi:MAG: class I SAM-dependent methyltransferase [Elusimicrobia bacterium]|nr:class I SAM-dependent methyltransferase [Elusimicrobiota bacterium]
MHNTTCPLCGAVEDYTVLYKSNFKEANFSPEIFSARRLPDTIHYQIVKCKNDGLVRSTPVQDQAQSDILYKRSKFNYAEQVENLTASYWRVLAEVLPRLSLKDRILEIGCGNGFVLSALAKNGYQQVYGLEPSLDAAAKANPWLKDKITTEVLKKGLYPPASFAFIYFLQTLDHIPEPLKFLSICYDLLLPGGMILALNHDVESFSARMLKEKSPIIDLEHMYLYSQDTVRRLFSKSGFTLLKIFSPASVISWRYLCWLLPLPKAVKIRILQAKGRVSNYLLRQKIWLRLGNLCIIARKPV